ncbi:MAG: autotransporter outer membrane beta-barrel domain-containing protein, partial [Verrucomicrobiota bacterium]|nr:autotransporter outer membrane beta-barrel domain-containing protein [Verrucomicrobiota bacterium]
ARGTEFRSMNGFASSKPRFGKQARPTGVAGPKTDDEKTMQGWIRAYGAFGNRDADSNFAAYESGTWGSVIGVDKSFGNLLVGLAGGFARSDVDAGTAYTADVTTYHGSIYSTIGGETVYVDLAATYGHASTEENNATMEQGEFDSDIISGYIGVGKSFSIKEKVSLTPEATFLASYYKQQAYDRTGVVAGSVDAYDTQSYMGTLGLNLATIHQLDWLNQGIAYIPEVRAHWLHDFNADPDDFTYTIGGTPHTFGVRPREEDLLRLGVGFDMWSWKYQNTKFELDYDGLFSSGYTEHVFSGKVTYRF